MDVWFLAWLLMIFHEAIFDDTIEFVPGSSFLLKDDESGLCGIILHRCPTHQGKLLRILRFEQT